MKKLLFFALALIFIGCSDDSPSPSPVIDLDVGSGSTITAKRIEGQISKVGEVDIYRLNLVESNRNLQIKCTSETLRPDVDLLVNIFEKQTNGDLVMIAGNHAPENGIMQADIKVNLFIDKPKELYVHVRDLLDDDSSNHSYFLSANFEAAPDGNESFENAVSLEVGGDKQSDMIGTVGDVDYFSFDVAESGVYDISVLFEPMPGTAVRLSMDLYDETGSLVDTRKPGNINESHMLHYLGAGSYKVVVDDDGRDDFDSASVYSIGVVKKNVSEMNENDTPDKADMLDSSSGSSIEYYEDRDIYIINPSSTPHINVLELGFQSDMPMQFQINMYRGPADGDFEPEKFSAEYSHDYRGGVDGEYQAVLKLDTLGNSERYFLLVKPLAGDEVVVSSPYSIEATIVTIEDPDETGSGNDSDATAIDLTDTPGPGNLHTGKLGYRGDVDWFEVTVPLSTSDRIFSVYLDIPVTNKVEYAMDIIRENRNGQGEDSSYSLSRRVFNGSSDHRTVDLKTAFIVPAQSLDLNDATYKIKVYDFQNDDADISDYTLSWNVKDIPNNPLSVPAAVSSYLYHDEKDEADNTTMMSIDYKNGSRGTFVVNTTHLDMNNDRDSNTNTVTFPWVAGYIDYEGDEDWFGLDLGGPLKNDTKWYYEISIEMYLPGSDLEYTLEYYPDSNHDGQVSYSKCGGSNRSCSGILASVGDDDLAVEDLNIALPDGDSRNTVLWLGSDTSRRDWRGMVYFRLSDFNYMFLDSKTPNPDADNDFGYDQPYFFRIKLNYFSGTEHPPEMN